jgi:hypothetical protein
MPAGIPGDISRSHGQATVEPGLMSSAAPFSAYGLPAKLNGSGLYVPFVGAEAATAFVGLLVRPYPTGATSSDGLGVGTPPQDGSVGNILKRGYMSVKLNGGATVVKGAQAYVRVANASGGKPIGGIEGAASGAASAVSAVKASGANTGNGTNVPDVTTPVQANAKAGLYTLRFTTATNVRLTDPTGVVLGDYTIGGATGNSVTITNQIKVVVTQGATVFIATDGFDVTVVLAGSETIAPAGLVFMGPADANANAEVAYNI